MAGLAVALAVAILALAIVVPPAGASAPGLFATFERQLPLGDRFPQWQNVLMRHAAERDAEPPDCVPAPGRPCHVRRWLRFLDGLRGQSQLQQLRAVNDYANRIPYGEDPAIYGMEDYWATPREFMYNGGDCEDYAIMKYLSLRKLGWPASALRIVVLRDENLGIGHAVLAARSGGVTYILDNQIRQVVPHDRIRHYRPVYSVNETHWWMHVRRRH